MPSRGSRTKVRHDVSEEVRTVRPERLARRITVEDPRTLPGRGEQEGPPSSGASSPSLQDTESSISLRFWPLPDLEHSSVENRHCFGVTHGPLSKFRLEWPVGAASFNLRHEPIGHRARSEAVHYPETRV